MRHEKLPSASGKLRVWRTLGVVSGVVPGFQIDFGLDDQDDGSWLCLLRRRDGCAVGDLRAPEPGLLEPGLGEKMIAWRELPQFVQDLLGIGKFH